MKELSTSDPSAHVANVGSGLEEIIDHLQRDVAKVTEPRARALFETAAEVLSGLHRAFRAYADDDDDGHAPGIGETHARGQGTPGPV